MPKMDDEIWVLIKNKESYGWKQHPFEALNAWLLLHPLASASCCSGMLATVIATTPNNASADTIAITANIVLFILNAERKLSFEALRNCPWTMRMREENKEKNGMGRVGFEPTIPAMSRRYPNQARPPALYTFKKFIAQIYVVDRLWPHTYL